MLLFQRDTMIFNSVLLLPLAVYISFDFAYAHQLRWRNVLLLILVVLIFINQYSSLIFLMALYPFYKNGILEAGCDEAGRGGCLAGPVVAAAVILDARKDYPLLNDSKKLSEKKLGKHCAKSLKKKPCHGLLVLFRLPK